MSEEIKPINNVSVNNANLSEEKELNEFFSWFPNMKKIPESPLVLYLIGFCYQNGMDVDINISNAIFYYEKAAEKNYAIAFYKLGILCFNGIGMPKDISKAKELFIKARDLGHIKADSFLEKFYN